MDTGSSSGSAQPASTKSDELQLSLERIILFSPDVDRLMAWYIEVLGLRSIGRVEGWVELDAGGCKLAIHVGRTSVGKRPPKLVFYSSDVSATRSRLIQRGLSTLGPIQSTETFEFCDGLDIDGNALQISSRR